VRAMILSKQAPIECRPLEPKEVADPEPREQQVRIRVTACGVCHTDLHIVEGDLELHKQPIIPGHEVIGVVDKLGPGASRFQPGDRVGVAWLYWTPPECKYRQRGLENLCDEAKFTGWDADGGFAEMMVVPEDFAYPIPDCFSDVEAAPLMCAGVVGFRALRLGEVEQAERVGLYGFGASAHLAIQVACYWGCKVYVFTRSEEHQRHARELGAAWVGEAQDDPGVKLDSAIIYAPAGWIVPEALRVLDKGGILVLAGIYMSPIPQMDYHLLWEERVVRSVANATRQDAEDFLRIAAAVPVRTDVITFALEEANEALRQVKHSEISGAAVLQVSGE